MDSKLLLAVFLLLLVTLFLSLHYLAYLHASYFIIGILVLVASILLSNLANEANSYRYDMFGRKKQTFTITDQFLNVIGIKGSKIPRDLSYIISALEKSYQLPIEDEVFRKYELRSAFAKKGFLIYEDRVFEDSGFIREKLIASKVYERSIYEKNLVFSDIDRTLALNKVVDNLSLDRNAAIDSKFIFILNENELAKLSYLLNQPYKNNSLLALRIIFGDVKVIS